MSPSSPSSTELRRRELSENLAEVRSRIAAAASSVGRSVDSVTLVVVTKTWPASDVRLLAELGVTEVGENRDQEAAPKAAELADLGLTWHFIGQLQTNKARSVATYAHVVESVDRLRLVSALDAAAEHAGRQLQCLVQVGLDPVPGRGGASGEDIARVADAVAASSWLSLAGVMAVAPLDADPDPAFARLQAVAADLRDRHPQAGVVSAGMSHDLESAVAHGATHVRVGTAVLGPRSSVG
ncbi:MAG: YggS family pyridoxal phosphate-dependent enzyme [Actinomycetes bacterium]